MNALVPKWNDNQDELQAPRSGVTGAASALVNTVGKPWSTRWSEVRFFGVLRESPPLHFYCLQAIAFFYLLWRFASRNYTVYGHLPAELFDYPREFNIELWPIPLLHITTLQFIYAFVPRPTPEVLFGMQYAVVALCGAGLLGLRPKSCAIGAFLLALHVTGMVQASNAEIDGGTLALSAMLVLAISPRESFYRFGGRFSLAARGVHYHWPVFLFMMIVGTFYSMAGLNKLVDIGPQWPLTLHLERLAAWEIEQALFVASQFSVPWVCSLHDSYVLSVIGGVVTLTAELAFIGILFLPRYRLTLIFTMALFHVLVFLMAGINFLGSIVLLLACFDWNVLVRTAKLRYVGGSKAVRGVLRASERMDWFRRLTIEIVPAETETQHSRARGQDSASLVLVDENGEQYEGIDAFEQVAARCPLLWPLALTLKLPGVMFLARTVVNRGAGVPRMAGHVAAESKVSSDQQPEHREKAA